MRVLSTVLQENIIMLIQISTNCHVHVPCDIAVYEEMWITSYCINSLKMSARQGLALSSISIRVVIKMGEKLVSPAYLKRNLSLKTKWFVNISFDKVWYFIIDFVIVSSLLPTCHNYVVQRTIGMENPNCYN